MAQVSRIVRGRGISSNRVNDNPGNGFSAYIPEVANVPPLFIVHRRLCGAFLASSASNLCKARLLLSLSKRPALPRLFKLQGSDSARVANKTQRLEEWQRTKCCSGVYLRETNTLSRAGFPPLLLLLEPSQLIHTPTGHNISQTSKDLRIEIITPGPGTTKLKCNDFCESRG